MTNEIKWIKLTTDMFDNRKIRHLRRLPEGNNIVLIWVMLLTMAGRCNAGGMIFLTKNIPYTTKMLSDELGFEENTIKLALTALEQLDMISMKNDMLTIPGWTEHQNIEGMDRIREQNRLRKQKQREREKLLASAPVIKPAPISETIENDKNSDENKGESGEITQKEDDLSDCDMPENGECDIEMTSHDSHVTVTKQNKIKDKRIRNKNIDTSLLLEQLREKYESPCENPVENSEDVPAERMSSVPYKEITQLYNDTCSRLPKIIKIDGTRKKAVSARWKSSPDIETFRRLFKTANDSDFLCGANERNWTADFDWLMKPQNMLKVLEGKYTQEKRTSPSTGSAAPDASRSYDIDEFLNLAMNRRFDDDGTCEGSGNAREGEKPPGTNTIADDPNLRERAEKLRERIQGGA